MTDFMFFIFTKVFGADLKDAHDIPWGTQIIFFPILGLIIGLKYPRKINLTKKV